MKETAMTQQIHIQMQEAPPGSASMPKDFGRCTGLPTTIEVF